MYPKNKFELQALVGKVIVFNESVEAMEIDFEAGMKGRVVSAKHNQNPGDDGDDGIFKLMVDFGGEFLEHNRKRMTANYYDGTGCPTLKWEQTKKYPMDHMSEDYYTYGTWHERCGAEPEFSVVEEVVVDKVNTNGSTLFNLIAANVDNDKLTDTEFRQFIRNSLPLTR